MGRGLAAFHEKPVATALSEVEELAARADERGPWGRWGSTTGSTQSCGTLPTGACATVIASAMSVLASLRRPSAG
jgi:hypothetical protein